MVNSSARRETAILVRVAVSASVHSEHFSQEDLVEFRELVSSAGIEEKSFVTASNRHPSSKYYIGSGKAQEIQSLVVNHQPSVVIINAAITASQERNLEKLFKCRVVDRTGLILDIFAKRAKTFEGKLQVELAQLNYLSTRLVRGWTHLERQKGGIGLRGPGETQLETDKRLIRGRIQTLEKRLEKVSIARDQNRHSRKRADMPTIALVGYTNAGKSTLFNRLTHSTVYVANQLFATLDPTLRRYRFDSGLSVVFADTVGFIKHLPHDLVAAFRATLLETREASLLLHVIDVHSALAQDHILNVNEVLKEISADKIAQIEVYNKIDLVPGLLPHIEANVELFPSKIWVSAEKNRGIDLLKQSIYEMII
jgi:GTP-binding protein HflX